MDLYQILKDFASPSVAFIALIFGYKQLQNWKNQLVYSQQHELAKKILLKTFLSRNALKISRSSFIPVQEMTLSKEELEALKTFEEKKEQGVLNAVNSRLKRCSEQFKGLDNLIVEAEIIWGSEVADLSNNFLRLYDKLYRYLETFVRKDGISNPRDYTITDEEIDEALKPIETYFRNKLLR